MGQLFSLLISFLVVQILFLASLSAQNATAPNSKGRYNGDINMKQFKNLKEKPKPADMGQNIQTTCVDPQGTIIKKGESGFDTCLANSQSPVMNQPRTAEIPNDPRKQ